MQKEQKGIFFTKNIPQGNLANDLLLPKYNAFDYLDYLVETVKETDW